jgi:hypothetical protein
MRRRMRSLIVVLPCLASALAACKGRSAADRYPEAGEGRLAAQAGGKQLFHSAARATYCRGDSILVVMAVTPRWTAGLALRAAFPVAAARSFTVRGTLAGEGTATAAFRAVTDSVEPALVGAGGTVRVEPGRLTTGRFDVLVPGSDERSTPRRILGAFRALPTTDTAATCGSTPRTP